MRFKMKKLFTFFKIFIIGIVFICPVSGQQLNDYNIVWNSQSQNSSESMPCGGGDIGLNVWVENGELLFYMSRSGTFDENNSMLKLGRVRVKLTPNPFAKGGTFKQELKLKEGYVEITGKKDNLKSTINVWVDVFRPVIHVDIKSNQPVLTEAVYENWRTKDRKILDPERLQCYGMEAAPFDVITRKDSVTQNENTVMWYHRNFDDLVFRETVKLQGMEEVKDEMWNPVINRTFGGVMSGSNMIAEGITSGKYYATEFSGWKLKSKNKSRSHSITVYTHLNQTETYKEWSEGLEDIIFDADENKKTAWNNSKQWWSDFWERSHIFIKGDKNEQGWRVGRNYQLFRYQLGCNAFGQHPTKFNGGLFTFDPGHVNESFNFSPDFRHWGGGNITAQNQRLVYWPMLKNGDFDLMQPQFDFYYRAQKNAELRSKFYWNHGGACFTEQMETFGLPVAGNYSFEHPDYIDKGVCFSGWIEYQWDTVLEFCLMMLDVQRFTGKDISESIPFIESCLAFFDEHYRYYSRNRTISEFDENGKYVFYPGTACETYKMTTNSVTTVGGLKVVLQRLLELPENYLVKANRKRWEEMLVRIPPITFREKKGKKVISPAARWERLYNHEMPQMYPVFPFGLYGLGKPDIDIAMNTWDVGYDRPNQKSCNLSWSQGVIFCARLGLTDEAKERVCFKLDDSKFRFPSFWGPGHDWSPDHNWGGSGSIGLQEMIMQTDNKKIIITPAWPKDWDAQFKLNAPYNTIVEAKVANGKVVELKVTPSERQKDVIIWGEKEIN